MSWQNNKDFKAEEFTKFGKNVWGEQLYIIRYKGFSNVTIEKEFNQWIKDVDELKI
jgi:G3E family GTPase